MFSSLRGRPPSRKKDPSFLTDSGLHNAQCDLLFLSGKTPLFDLCQGILRNVGNPYKVDTDIDEVWYRKVGQTRKTSPLLDVHNNIFLLLVSFTLCQFFREDKSLQYFCEKLLLRNTLAWQAYNGWEFIFFSEEDNEIGINQCVEQAAN